MGTTSSSQPVEPPISMQMDGMANYPDMNVIFKGIPKMMQVADDMHRMANYIMDLRNMTFGLSIISVLGMFMFLLLKYIQGKKRSRRYRHRFQNIDSEQSSLSRTMGAIGSNDGGGSRHYSQKPLSTLHNHHHNNMDWNLPAGMRHVPIDMEKLIESQHSNSTAALIGGGHHNSRQTPPHQQRNLPTYATLHAINNGGGVNGSNSTSTTIALTDSQNDCSSMQQQHPVLVSMNNPMTSTIAATSTSLANGGGGSDAYSSQLPNGAPATLKVGVSSNNGGTGPLGNVIVRK